jgi:hypothetical protein
MRHDPIAKRLMVVNGTVQKQRATMQYVGRIPHCQIAKTTPKDVLGQALALTVQVPLVVQSPQMRIVTRLMDAHSKILHPQLLVALAIVQLQIANRIVSSAPG